MMDPGVAGGKVTGVLSQASQDSNGPGILPGRRPSSQFPVNSGNILTWDTRGGKLEARGPWANGWLGKGGPKTWLG